MEPPYQSRPLLQRRRRRSSAASAAALCSPSERHRVSRPPQPSRRAATTPSRPLGSRPRPPRCAHCRLQLRAADAAATDAAASSFAPPSFSLKANKHHGGGRRPPASEYPDRRRRSNIPAAHWPPPPGATIRCPTGWVAPLSPLPKPRPLAPRAGRRCARPARSEANPPASLPALLGSFPAPSSLPSPLLNGPPFFHLSSPPLFFWSQAVHFCPFSSLTFLDLFPLRFPSNHVEKRTFAFSQLICLKTRRSIVNSLKIPLASDIQKKKKKLTACFGPLMVIQSSKLRDGSGGGIPVGVTVRGSLQKSRCSIQVVVEDEQRKDRAN